ncbi:MAG TPA: hypothetical protein VII11_00345 [Bacteroidota bacterium]
MADVAKSIDVTFTDLLRTSGAFTASFNAGLQGVGQGINQWIGGAFRRTFGEAKRELKLCF